MNKNFLFHSMFVKPEQAVELFNLGLDQSKTVFFWCKVVFEENIAWMLVLQKEKDSAVFLTGDERAMQLKVQGVNRCEHVQNVYAAFDMSQLVQILQNEIMAVEVNDNDCFELPLCRRDYPYEKLTEGYADYLIGMLHEHLCNDDQCNGALEIYADEGD